MVQKQLSQAFVEVLMLPSDFQMTGHAPQISAIRAEYAAFAPVPFSSEPAELAGSFLRNAFPTY